MSFRFQPDTHEYFLGPDRLPSVTTILNSWHEVGGLFFNHVTGATVPAYIFEAARDRGNAVHKIFEYAVQGQGVDETALDASLHGYYRAICGWMDHYRPEPILVECPLCDEKLRYAGTLDLYGRVKGNKHNVLIDVKTGDEGPIGEQTAAYLNLVRIAERYKLPIDRYVLKIGDGGYEFKPVGTPQDFKFFTMRLTLHHYDRRTT
jgi:hypothetical protein